MEHEMKSLMDFEKRFPDEQTCRDYLEKARWNDEPVCAQCGSTRKVYRVANGRLLKCADCRRQFSVRVGTIFEDSPLPLKKWFMAIYILTAHKKGISSIQLSKDLGITQKTAWFMLHRIRYAVENRTFVKPMTGIVEVDESFFGKKAFSPKLMSGKKSKGVVFGMLERGGEVRAFKVPHARRKLIEPIMKEHISPDARVMSDDSNIYDSISPSFRLHQIVNHSNFEWSRGLVHTNSIEGFWSVMKRGINGIYHHVSKEHLQRYADEFAYRYNSRKSTDPDRFDRFFDQVEGRLTWKKLVPENKEKGHAK